MPRSLFRLVATTLKRSALLGILLVFPLAVAAQPLGLEDLQGRFNRIDTFLAGEMQDAGIPSLALAITRNGEVVLAKAFGQAQPGIKAQVDTPFALGSISKGMTAMALMTLVDEGKLDPARPVRAYLETFRTADHRSDSITVSQLLSHTSGFSTMDGRNTLTRSGASTIRSMLGGLKGLKLASAPGTRFEYSNWNYIVAGAVIEAVSGKDYATFMKERIFQPLGMNHTGFLLEGAALGSRSFLGFSRPGAVPLPGGVAPAGGIFSTARDMGNYLVALQKDGLALGGPVVSPTAFVSLTTGHAPTKRYGYGWGLTKGAIYHAGDNAEFHGDIYLQRVGEVRWGIAILCAKNDPLAETFDPEGAFQMRLMPGVLGILTGQGPKLPLPHAGTRRIILVLVALGLAAAALGSIASLRKGKRSAKRSVGRGFLSVLLNLGLHLVLPLTILVALPAVTASTWPLLLVWAPDAGWILGGFAIVELVVGIVKVIVTINDFRAPRLG